MDRSRYPEDWERIVSDLRQRCMGRCECAGECGKHSGACGATHRELHPRTGSVVILTTAHLWQGPCAEHHRDGIKCGDPEHLKEMCQACHLAYDLEHHVARRAANRHAKRAAADLFLPNEATLG